MTLNIEPLYLSFLSDYPKIRGCIRLYGDQWYHRFDHYSSTSPIGAPSHHSPGESCHTGPSQKVGVDETSAGARTTPEIGYLMIFRDTETSPYLFYHLDFKIMHCIAYYSMYIYIISCFLNCCLLHTWFYIHRFFGCCLVICVGMTICNGGSYLPKDSSMIGKEKC